MNFYGKLKRRSFIYNNFCDYQRASGMIDGALYRRIGQDYVSDLLTQGQINSIRARQDGAIELIATTLVPLGDETQLEHTTTEKPQKPQKPPENGEDEPVVRSRRRATRRRLPDV